MERHKATVEAVRSRIQHFYTSKAAFRIYHGSTNSTRHADFDREAIVDVSTLNHILSIDHDTQTAIVEPNVPMDVLVQETMKAGLLPPVVMEFPGITVGGGFVGTAGESSSFKHGFFDRTILSAEVVLADGTLVTASASQNADLFEGLRGSFGTLGVLTMVEMQLIPLRQLVEVTYHPTFSFENATGKIKYHTTDERNDYVDGVLFSKGTGVIVTGRLIDTTKHTPNLPVQRFSRPWDEWFWIHAKSVSSRGIITKELVPIQDYLFRYDRGAFWMGMYAYKHFMVPFTRLTRFLFDYFMHTRVMYHALHASGYTDRYIIHDIAFPADNATLFLEYADQAFGLYPIWLCPLRRDGRSSMGHAKPFSGLVGGKEVDKYKGEDISVGLWGPYPSGEAEYVRANREIEEKMRELGGLKWLYSRVFYTEDEWWQVYDRHEYEKLRHMYNATSLPSIWDKVKDRGRKEDFGTGVRGLLRRLVKSNTFLSGLYGIYKAIKGEDYILKQKTA
jgi:delta24-sterol reductase